jgi:hypothetical protein
MEMLLEQREMLDLDEDLQGVKIVCQHGQCWITQSGDDRDHIIKSGGIFSIRTKEKVIVTAIESCRIMLVESKKSSTLQSPYMTGYNFLKNCLINSTGKAHLS